MLAERGDVSGRHIRSSLFVIAALAVVGVSALASAHLWRENGLRSLQAVNEPRIELIASAVRSEINRQDHLPLVLSLDADVRNALTTPQDKIRLQQLNEKLERIVSEADARALYVIGRDGIVLTAGHATPTEVLVGRALADRSYFVKAVESGRSSYLGVDPTSNRIRYYLTEAIRDTGLLGVAV